MDQSDGAMRSFRILLTGLALASAALGQRAGAAPRAGDDPFAAVEDHLFNLEYDAASQELKERLRSCPADLRALNLLGTVLLHREMFYRGVLEVHLYGELGEMFRTGKVPISAAFQKEFFGVLEKAQTLAESRLKQNPRDQEALYAAGSAHATRAVFYFTMARSYLAALRESVEARKNHAELLKVNPNFVDAWLVVGINDYVAGSLPWYVKVLASLAGYRGNRAQGIDEVKRVAEQGNWAREDARFVLGIFLRREKRYPETIQVLESLARSYPRNFLVRIEMAAVYKTEGDGRAAARIYDDLLAAHDADPGTSAFPEAKYLYEAGQIHTQLGETAQALAYFERAGKLAGRDAYVYRADLAAADLDLRAGRRDDALRLYRKVASEVPNSPEGKTATRALRNVK